MDKDGKKGMMRHVRASHPLIELSIAGYEDTQSGRKCVNLHRRLEEPSMVEGRQMQ